MGKVGTHPKDLAAGFKSALVAWGIPSAVILLTAWLDVNASWRTLAWTAALVWAGVACVLNASRCGRLHCHFTGPFFLLLAGTTLAYGLGLIPLGADGWRWIGLTFFVGGCLLTYVPEWIWGTYRRQGQDQCC